MSSETSRDLESASATLEADPNATWVADPDSTRSDSDPSSTHSPTLTESSTTTPPTTPPRGVRPAHTVVNDTAGIQRMLDDVVSHMTIPPKLYSKAHSWPSHTDTIPSYVQSSPPELYVDAEGTFISEPTLSFQDKLVSRDISLLRFLHPVMLTRNST